jgi:hypothetical protein
MEAENKVRVPEEAPIVHSEDQEAPSGGKTGGLPVQDVGRYIRYTIFLVGLGLLFIWNSHVAEKQVRRESRLKREIEDAKAEYKAVHAQQDAGTRQSVIFQKVDTLGLEASSKNIFKLPRKEKR